MTSAHEAIISICDWIRERPESGAELATAAGLTRNALRRVKGGENQSFNLETLKKLEQLRVRLEAASRRQVS